VSFDQDLGVAQGADDGILRKGAFDDVSAILVAQVRQKRGGVEDRHRDPQNGKDVACRHAGHLSRCLEGGCPAIQSQVASLPWDSTMRFRGKQSSMTTSWETLAALAAKGEIRLHLDLASILGYILIGLVVGLVARFIVPGRDPLGLLGTLLVGVVGAVIGGWLAGEVFAETAGVDWIASILVAAVLVLLLRAGSRRRVTSGRW
jgi:uncharacterized membrane protein YeaQ/YmgE (transglycosylase-associated protein family)